MSQQLRTVLKSYFETGDFPTEAEFIDLIDSLICFQNDGVGIWQKTTLDYTALQPNVASSGFANAFNVAAGFQPSLMIVRQTVQWAAVGATSINLNFYHPTLSNEINTVVLEGLDPVTDTVGGGGVIKSGAAGTLIDISSGGDVRLFCQMFGGGAVIDDLTAGELDIWWQLMKMI